MSLPFGVPGTSETDWEAACLWDQVPVLDTTDITTLVLLAAHPDDEILGAGGLLTRAAGCGWDVQVIVATNGEGSHPDSPTHSPEQLAERRRIEVAEAVELAAPGASVLFLDLPDGELSLFADDLDGRLRAELAPLPPSALVASPWRGDRHPDHEAMGLAAARICSDLRINLLEYPIWLWHWSSPEEDHLPTDTLVRLDLTTGERETKLAALDRYTSQLRPLSPAAGDESVVEPAMVEHFSRPYELFMATAVTADQDAAAPVASLDRPFFDDFYGDRPDPWGFADRWYEIRKRSILLASLPRERFRSALEPGCANGDLTEDLARRCERVLATEISPAPRARAAARLADLSGVTVSPDIDPALWAHGAFDLVVISEIGYYCDAADLERLVRGAVAALAEDGVLAVCHWRHPVAEYPLTGDTVHLAFRAHPEVEVLVAHQEEDFLLDLLVRAPAVSVASATGLRPAPETR